MSPKDRKYANQSFVQPKYTKADQRGTGRRAPQQIALGRAVRPQHVEFLQTQRDMAQEIVDKLKLRVSGNEKGLAKNYTENNDAYQLYRKGLFIGTSVMRR